MNKTEPEEYRKLFSQRKYVLAFHWRYYSIATPAWAGVDKNGRHLRGRAKISREEYIFTLEKSIDAVIPGDVVHSVHPVYIRQGMNQRHC